MRNTKKIRGNRSIHSVCIEACEQRLLMSTYTVNTTSDAVNPGSGLLSLRQAIAQADASSTSSTIGFSSSVFGPGAMHTITLTQGQLNLKGTTTITGPAAGNLTVDANETGRIFQISSGSTVTLQNMTITNGLVATAPGVTAIGGAILSYGNIQLTNDTISNSKSTGGTFTEELGEIGTGGAAYGGGIYSTGTLGLTNSTITGNIAQAGGSYDFGPPPGVNNVAQGGGIYSTGRLTISGSTLSSNSAIGGEGDGGATGGASSGGGIFVTGAVNVTGTTLSGNLSRGGEGQPTPAAQDSGANASGGAIYLTGASVLSSDTFTGNNAVGGSSGGGGGSAGAGMGGAVYSAGSVSMSASTLSSNTAAGGNGPFDDSGPGGAGQGGAITSTGTFNISGSTLSDNTAAGGLGSADQDQFKANGAGGAIYSTGTLSLTTSSISGNTANASPIGGGDDTYGGSGGNSQGGGLFVQGTTTITNSTISGNTAQGGVGDAPYHGGTAGPGGSGQGGGIYSTAGMVTITNSTLALNAANGGAGGLGGYEGGDGGTGGSGYGGAIDSLASLVLFDSTVSGNSAAPGTGGALGNAFSDTGYFPGGPGRALGAGVTVAAAYCVAVNSIISGNQDTGAAEDDVQGEITGAVIGSTAIYSVNNLIGTGSGLINGTGGNIVGVDNPMLSPLASNGGPTLTMLPLPTSPAVNSGSSASIPAGITTDQRGSARIAGPSVDIGAVELQVGTVSGLVFNDLNGDGVQQAGETGLANVTVYADLSNSGALKAGDPTAVTNYNGNYTLNGVPEGAIIIRQETPTGDRQSYPVGGDGEHVSVTAAGVSGALFADSTRLYVSGSVTLNGVGQSGVLVYADLNNDGKFESNENNKTTASDGSFAFVSLTPGTYTLRVVPPTGETINGNSAFTVTLGSGGVDTAVDFTLTKSTTQQQLTGTVIGTSGSYNNQGNTAANAFDKNLNTFFDAPTASGSYTGLDLGYAKVITQICYAPRSGWASRMIGGMFQGSNSANFSGAVTLYTITSTPVTGSLTTVSISNTTAFRYVRYIGPANGYCNIAEAEFFGTSSTTTGAASLNSNGQLTVNGTSGADNILLNFNASAGGGLVNVTVDGALQTFNWSSVKSVVINSGDGNDTINVAGFGQGSANLPPVSISAGNGNDSFILSVDEDGSTNGAAASLSLTAGNGNDSFQINASSANVMITAGNGSDTFNTTTDIGTGNLHATITAGDGNDSITTGESGATGSQYVVFNAGIGNDTVTTTDRDDYTSGTIAGQTYSLITSDEELLGNFYSDVNGDGNFESSEPLVANAAVSFNNSYAGTFGTTTDATGRFLLSVPYDEYEPPVETYGWKNPILLQGSGSEGQLISGVDFALPTALTGAVIGTAGSYQNAGNTASRALDENLSTYFDAPTASGAYVGLDLGSAKVITSIVYAPRSGWASRMVGGMFQGSNSADFSTGVVTLYTVTSTPATGVFTEVALSNTTAYRYVRYVGPANSYCNIAEAEFFANPPSFASVNNGNLTVTGTESADVISVT